MSTFDLSKYLYSEIITARNQLPILPNISPTFSTKRTLFERDNPSNPTEYIHLDEHDHSSIEIKRTVQRKISSSSLLPINIEKSTEMKNTPKAIGQLLEKYKTPHFQEKRLRLLIVGHNPSERSWMEGHYYANPTNRMWPILRETEIIPKHFTYRNDDDCPSELGIGFTDLGTGHCETKSSKISNKTLKSYKKAFYERILHHIMRVQSSSHGFHQVGSYTTCQKSSDTQDQGQESGCPQIIAFAGVRQWKSLFHSNFFKAAPMNSDASPPYMKRKRGSEEGAGTMFSYGRQDYRPEDWPGWLAGSEVYVVPSTSGANVMSHEDRISPYRLLARRLQDIPWTPAPPEIGVETP